MRTNSVAPSCTAEDQGNQFRNTLALYPSGVTVISSMVEGEPVGFTCQAFYSVSLEPQLVSFSVMRTSASYPRVRQSSRFVVNLLSDQQRRLSDQFARSGTDKWRGVTWDMTPSGLPALKDTLGWIEGSIWDEHIAGDHIIVIGEVTALHASGGGSLSPLVFFDKAYRQLAAP